MFKDKVLKVVSRIPAGEMLTYKEVARRAGNPRAARAVGTIMRRNFDPQVPCHRVICSDGSLGNYNRGGSAAKCALLISEGALPSSRESLPSNLKIAIQRFARIMGNTAQTRKSYPRTRLKDRLLRRA